MFTRMIENEKAKQKAKMIVNGKFSLKAIMSYAWQVARNLQRIFGGKVSSFMAEAMKKAWTTAKG